MQYFVLLSAFVAIFVFTEAAKPRSINVALETVFEFENSSDVDFINQIQNILNKVKNLIKENPTQNVNKSTNRHYKFTDFLEDILVTLFAFNDEDLMEILQIIENEFRKNIQINALQENVRRYLTNELDRIKTKPVQTIRKSLDKLLRKVQNAKNGKKNNFLGFINTLYKRDAEQKLAKFVRNLKIFRRSSQKVKKDSVKKAIQFIFEHFPNLSEDIKRMAELRIKDYPRDRFSISQEYNKNYPRTNDKPHEVKLEPALVLQNSEDTETSKETIDIEERNFKPKININEPHLALDRSEETELLSTRTFAKNKIVKHKKDREENVPKRTDKYDNLPQITYKKSKKSHNQKFKKTNKHYNKMHSNKLKLTVYPGNIKMEKRNFKVRFRATIPVALNGDYITRTTKDRALDERKITFISHNPEVNFNLKNNKIQFVPDYSKDDLRKDALMKVRALREKLMESRKNRMEFTTTSNHSDEYFGNLFKSKGMTDDRSDSRRFISSNINDTYRIREFLNQIEDDTTTSNAINKLNKMHGNLEIKNNAFKNTEGNTEERLTKQFYVTKNKSVKDLKTKEISTEYDRSKNIGYRRAKEAKIAENKPNRKLQTLKAIENDVDLTEELNIGENNHNKLIKTNENIEKLADFKFIKNKTENILKIIEITTESEDIVKNRGFKRIKEPKIIENVSLSLMTTNSISNVARNLNKDNKLIKENHLELTTKKFLNTHRIHVNSNTKSDKVIDKAEEIVNLKKINSDDNLKKHSKISRQTPEKETINFTKSDDFSKIINKTNPIINSKHANAIIESDSKKNSKNINELQVFKRKLNRNASITTNINRKIKSTSLRDTEKQNNTKTTFQTRHINVIQKSTTKSYNKEIEPINYETNDSIWQQHLTPKVTENEKLTAKLQVNNEIKTKEFDPIFDINRKYFRPNNTNTNDSRRRLNVNPKTSTISSDSKLKEDFQRTKEIDLSLDIRKYLKNPEVTDVEDNQKKKEIEQKIKEDLGKLLTLPATNATSTVAYTDIFEVMENDFDLGPLK